ncbi:MAG: DUF3303 family protein [Candidatus Odinarchaeia archaeon]
MTLAFIIFYKIKKLSNQEADDAKRDWDEFKKKTPEGLRIAAEYDHAWGSKYNGIIIVESEKMEAFLEWWRKFRDFTRWYVIETRTITCTKD